MDPTRIVVLNDTSRPVGGTAKLAMTSLFQLQDRGLPVALICGDDGADPALADRGIPVHAGGGAPLLDRPRLRAMREGLYDPRMYRLVADYIAQKDDPGTVYHLHAWAQILSPAIFAALAPVAERVYVHAHDLFIACPNCVFMDYRRGEVCTRRALSAGCIATNCDKRAYHHKLWRVARHAVLQRSFDVTRPWAGVIQIHPDMVSRLERGGIPAHLCRTLRNPAEPYCATRVPAETNAGLLFVGRLEEDKGVMALARAARRTGLAVTFVGDGAMRPALEAEFPLFPVTGWLTRERIGALAADARALVMPSLHPEPFAMVLPEAIQSGLPVLVADTALMADEITERGLGLAFDVRSDAAFDAALIALRDMPADRLRAMSEAGFAASTPLALTEQAWISGLIELYQDALLRQRPLR